MHAQVLFLNMESDIGIVAAFVYAHDQASKGMIQLVQIIEDGLGDQENPPQATVDELELVEQVPRLPLPPLSQAEHCAALAPAIAQFCGALQLPSWRVASDGGRVRR